MHPLWSPGARQFAGVRLRRRRVKKEGGGLLGHSIKSMCTHSPVHLYCWASRVEWRVPFASGL